MAPIVCARSASPAPPRSAATASAAARSHSCGSCSAWPGSALVVAMSTLAWASTRPVPSVSAALSAEVPRSSPSASGGGRSGMRLQRRDRAARGLERGVDVLVRVREGHEEVLEGMRVEEYAPLEHPLPPLAEERVARVAMGVAVVADGHLREPHLHHRSQSHDVRV